MLTLCIDTAHKYLTCALIRDDEIIASYSKECFKRQSEMVFSALEEIFDQAKVARDSIDSLCITKGPGSYTGVRIAMSLAKTYCEVAHKDLYVISTLKLYAAGKKKAMVLMDARAKRAYVGVYDGNKTLLPDCAMEIEKINHEDYEVLGDGSLVGLNDNWPSIPQCFLACRNEWEKVEDIAYLVPEYLKESESYYR